MRTESRDTVRHQREGCTHVTPQAELWRGGKTLEKEWWHGKWLRASSPVMVLEINNELSTLQTGTEGTLRSDRTTGVITMGLAWNRAQRTIRALCISANASVARWHWESNASSLGHRCNPGKGGEIRKTEEISSTTRRMGCETEMNILSQRKVKKVRYFALLNLRTKFHIF